MSPRASTSRSRSSEKAESLNIAQTAAGIATLDLDFSPQRWICSDNFHELLGLPAGDVARAIGTAGLRSVHPDDFERMRRAPLETSPRDALPIAANTGSCSTDGSERWIGEKADVTHGPDGEVVRITGRAHGHHAT